MTLSACHPRPPRPLPHPALVSNARLLACSASGYIGALFIYSCPAHVNDCVCVCVCVHEYACVCVCVFGFYNFHLPKHSKFFQSVYYIYYLSHAQPALPTPARSLYLSLSPALPLSSALLALSFILRIVLAPVCVCLSVSPCLSLCLLVY